MTGPTAPPQISPDGRFYWDGQAWQPLSTAPVKVTPALGARLAGLVAIVGVVIGIIGIFMPWITLTAPFVGTISKTGVDTGDGVFLLGILALCALLGLVVAVRPGGRLMPIVILAAAILCLLVVSIDFNDVSGRVARAQGESQAVIAQVGSGIYAVGLGALVVVVGGLIGALRKQDSSPATSAA